MGTSVLSRPVRHAPRPGTLPRPAVVVVALAAAVLTGIATSIGQGGSPVVATFANAAGPWFAVAVLLVSVARPRPVWASVLGVASLELMHVGYWLATVLAGHPDVLSPFGLWELLGVPAGVLAGLVAVGVRARDGRLRALALGAAGAVLVGEGARGLLVVAATTSSHAWTAEVVAGVAAVAAGIALGGGPVGRVVALATGVVGSAAVVAALLLV